MTFLTFEYPERVPFPKEAEICDTDRVVCFEAFEPSPEGQ